MVFADHGAFFLIGDSVGTNSEAIRQMIDAGVQVRQLDNLHAKVYLFPDGAVLGTSNASSNGLSMQDKS